MCPINCGITDKSIREEKRWTKREWRRREKRERERGRGRTSHAPAVDDGWLVVPPVLLESLPLLGRHEALVDERLVVEVIRRLFVQQVMCQVHPSIAIVNGTPPLALLVSLSYSPSSSPPPPLSLLLLSLSPSDFILYFSYPTSLFRSRLFSPSHSLIETKWRGGEGERGRGGEGERGRGGEGERGRGGEGERGRGGEGEKGRGEYLMSSWTWGWRLAAGSTHCMSIARFNRLLIIAPSFKRRKEKGRKK